MQEAVNKMIVSFCYIFLSSCIYYCRKEITGMNDNRKFINSAVVNLMTLFPELDEAKLAIRLEEVASNFDMQEKTIDGLKNDLVENIKMYVDAKRLEGLSELTLEGYYRELMIFEFHVQKPTSRITTMDIRQYLSTREDVQNSTLSTKLSIIKSFFVWLVDEEIVLRNPARKIKSPKQPKRLPKAFSQEELEKLREACFDTRERALVEVFYSTGCRMSEVSNMLRKDIDWSKQSTRVIGKGDKERIAYLNDKAVFHLKKYLDECEYGENDSPYVFSTGVRPFRQLSNAAIGSLIKKIAARTDIKESVHAHRFRHSMATHALSSGMELVDLQMLLGHEKADTTLRYAHVSEDRKQQAHRKYIQ